MINDALEFIRRELRIALAVAESEVIVDTPRTVGTPGAAPGVYISVVNVQQDIAFRTHSTAEQRGIRSQYREPPLHLNVDVLFAFAFPTYGANLEHLSTTLDFFQLKPMFTPSTQDGADSVPFPPVLERVVFDMVNMNLAELNDLWTAVGSPYLPSVVYRVHLAKAQLNAAGTKPELTTIQLDAAL